MASENPLTAANASAGAAAGSRDGTVLVVDDDEHLVGMYAARLEEDHTVRTAVGGEAALEQIDDDIDVVLLDRRMPELTGDEVLERIRAQGYECQVAMVTAIEPDMNIIDLPFDAYAVKPVREQDLKEIVANLQLRAQYTQGVQEVMAISSRLAAIESQVSDRKLSDHDEYDALCNRKQQLESANQDRMAELMERGDTGLVYKDVLGELQQQ